MLRRIGIGSAFEDLGVDRRETCSERCLEATVCQQMPGRKSDWGSKQFGGTRWAGGFWREMTPRPGPRKG